MNKHQSDKQDKTYLSSKKNQNAPKQLKQFNQIKIIAYHAISKILSELRSSKLSLADQQSINRKVNQLYKQVNNTKSNSHGLQDLHKIVVHLIRIKATERLTIGNAMVDRGMSHVALSHQQFKAMSTEMKTLNQQIIAHLSSSQNELSIQEAFADGINSFSGFYRKWLAISQTYLLKQLKKTVAQIRPRINKSSLSLTAKRLAMQRISSIDNRAQKNIMESSQANGRNAATMHKVQQDGIHKLQKVATDQDHVLQMMTSFDKFVDQIRKSVVKLNDLSRGIKVPLIKKINYYQNTVLDKFKYPFNAVADHILDAERPKLIQKIVSWASQSYYQELADQVPDFNRQHKYGPIASFKDTSRQLQQQLINGQMGPLDLDQLIKALKRFDQVAKNAKASLYQVRIDRALNDLSLQIANHDELSPTDQQRLYNQTVIYSKYIKRQPFTFRSAFIKRRLTAFFDRQYLYVIRKNALAQMMLLQSELRNSRLKPQQRKAFLAKVLKIWKTSQIANVKKASLSQIEAQGLTADRRQNLSQLMNLFPMIQKRINDPKINESLRHKAVAVIKKVGSSKSIPQADHAEQQGENELYCSLWSKHNPASQDRKQIISDQRRKFHDEINLAILHPDLKQVMNDSADRYVNIYGDKMLQKQGIAQSKTRWSTQLSHAVNLKLTPWFSVIQQDYLARADNSIRDLYYQLMAYSSSRTVLKRFAKVRLQALKKVRQAKQLMPLESSYQNGLRDVHKFASKIMGSVDSHQLKFNQQLHSMLKDALQKLGHNPIKSAEVKSAFVNRMIKVANQMSNQANFGSDNDLNEILRTARQQFSQVLQQSYQYDWSKQVSRAKHVMNDNLVSVSDSVKQSNLSSLKNTDLNISKQLNQGPINKLLRIFNTGQHQLRQVVQHGIYSNPAKYSIYQKLNTAGIKARGYINKFTASKMRTKYLKRLAAIKNDINHRMGITNNDHELLLISQTSYRKIDSLEREAVRKSQLNKFSKYSSKVEDGIQKLKLLNNHERRLISEGFNRAYHKSIYQISHASGVDDYQSYEQKGTQVLSKVLNHGKTLNAKKDKYLHAIVVKINHAKQQIHKLNKLSESDKKASNHLLDEIKQRSVHTIGNAANKKQLLSTEKNNQKMVSQILDKISSADVLVSAIQSADAKISQSPLNNSQKQRMLKKIRRVIGSEVDNDRDNPKKSSVKKDAKDKNNHKK